MKTLQLTDIELSELLSLLKSERCDLETNISDDGFPLGFRKKLMKDLKLINKIIDKVNAKFME